MIATLIPPQLSEIAAQLEGAQMSGSLDENAQLLWKVSHAEEHLRYLSKATRRSDKGGERELPVYALDPPAVRKVNQSTFPFSQSQD